MGKLVCVVCSEEKPVPKCCGNEEMLSKGSHMVCKYCGAIQYYPLHCGKLMKYWE
ncbi:MAG: hypothetical protein ABIG96_02640 [Candidatus Micrarchaeota archaeon]